MDLVLEKNGLLYPIEIKCKTNLTKADCSGLKAFLKTYPHKKIQPALVIYAGTEVYQLDDQTLAIPWTLL